MARTVWNDALYFTIILLYSLLSINLLFQVVLMLCGTEGAEAAAGICIRAFH